MADAQVNTSGDDFNAYLANLRKAVPGAFQPIPSPLSIGGEEKSLKSAMTQEQNLVKEKSDIYKQMEAVPTADFKDLPKAPQQEYTNPIQAFGQLMPTLAIFASLRTRAPMTSAMNAAASAMNAYHKGETSKFELAQQQWKDNLEWALKENQVQSDKYKAIIDRKNIGIAEKQAEIEGVAHLFQDNVALSELRQRGYDGFLKTQEARDSAALKLQEQYDKHKIAETKEQQFTTGKIDWAKLDKTDIVPGTGLTVGAIEVYGDAIINGAKPSQLGLGYGMNPVKKAVDNYVAYKKPGFDMAKAETGYLGQQREASALAARSAPAKLAVKEMDTLGKPMIDAISALNPTDFPTFNSLENAAAKGVGGTAVVKANLAVQEFKTAFTNLMVRNGVATDQARGKADELIAPNMSLDQIKAVVDQAKLSGAAVIDAINEAKGESVPEKETKVLGGVTYHKVNGEWYAD